MKTIKLGVIADLHGGYATDAEKRLDAFLNAMKKEKCDGHVQLGDFAFPNKDHQKFADKFNAAHATRIHVIGNHEFDYGLEREDCYKAWGIKNSFYRQDIGGLSLLVLDGNESGSPSHDGGYHSYIGAKQKAWLEKELSDSDKPILILSHQPLAGVWAIDNASEIQKLLSKHWQKIIVCLNGHSHVDSLVQVNQVNYLHVNSASYFWVGGKVKKAYYKEPLYTTLTVDPAAATVSVKSKATDWLAKSPAELEYFEGDDPPPREIVTPQIRARKIARQIKP